MKTLLVGNFGNGNVGDELILDSALADYPDCIVMTSNAEVSQKFCEKSFFSVPFFPTGFRSFLQLLFYSSYRRKIFSLRKDIDRVVFAGGGLLAIKFRAYFLWWMMSVWVRVFFPRAEIRWEHQGVDYSSFFLNKFFVRSVIFHASYFSVRDEDSRETVRVLTGKDVPNLGDRVEKMFQKNIFTKTREKKGALILVNAVRPFDIKLLKNISGRRVFVAFEEKDLKNAPLGFIGEKVFPRTKTEVVSLFSCAEKIIGERFHSLVLGKIFFGAENTFLLREPYSRKVSAFVSREKIHIFQ